MLNGALPNDVLQKKLDQAQAQALNVEYCTNEININKGIEAKAKKIGTLKHVVRLFSRDDQKKLKFYV
uniref:Uncharacterized protein n=1 Tax=Romanomermis culicivorax TaxID=13658 RepID=A0A915L066_ROMCU